MREKAKRNNLLFRYDPWYQEMIAQFSEDITDFRALWGLAAKVPHQEHSPVQTLLARSSPRDDLHPIQFQQRLLSVTSSIFPAISALFPGDEAARHLFSSLDGEPV
jgi:hypothetical protein